MTDGVDYCKECFHKRDDHIGPLKCGVEECNCSDYIHGETRVTSSTGASKGTKEERFDLIPVPALTYLARLYGKGAVKYAAHNWRLGYDWSKSYAAAQRHMNAFWAGENIDPETQVPHVINAAFHMFALATYITEHPEFDDRFETRDGRSDDTPQFADDRVYTNVDGEKKTKFFSVSSKEYAGFWINQGYFFSKEKAEQRIKDLRATQSMAELGTEYQILEGIFQDG